MRTAKGYGFNGLAGCVTQRKNRKTGNLIGVYHGEQSGIESDPESPWVTLCEEHGNLVCHRSLRLAMDHAAAPEMWCEDCQ
jgi:hypothetical protein